jgi:hypothetical protein
MTYSVDLYFKPAVPRRRLLQYFAARRWWFAVAQDEVRYHNEDTGVYLYLTLRCARTLLFQTNVGSAEFVVNYHRPSYVGVEAERELSAFVTAFKPRIEDPQISGMGEGPYSREGFLSGWNFGNVFSVSRARSDARDLTIPSMPADELRAVWRWNYNRAERSDRFANRCFVPTIMFFRIEGRLSRVIVWPQGMPVLLPKVDHVLVGRLVEGEKRFGLAPWSRVLRVLKQAGFDTTRETLDLSYFVTPPPIATWVAAIPLIDLAALERVGAPQILDDELIAAARASISDDEETSDLA